jgi:hypothetical protein
VAVGITGTLTVGGQTAHAGEPTDAKAAIYEAAAMATTKGWTEKTRMVGFSIIKTPFTEVPREGAVLVGFDLGLGKFMEDENIYALRAIYRTADGEASYGEHGLFKDKHGPGKKVIKSKVKRVERLRAPQGYAVGSVRLRTGLNIDAMLVTYMRINGKMLDPRDTLASEWVGNRNGGGEATLSGDGAPIVGVFGNEDAEHVMALGLISVQQPSRPKPAKAASAPAKAAPAKAVSPPPRAEPAQPEEDEPAAPAPRPDMQPAERFIDKYVNHEYHFSLTVPDGWQRMSKKERKMIDTFVRQRGLADMVQYDMGFRPNGSSPGTFPYIMVQVFPFKTAGLSYQEIQNKLDLGIDEPMKVVEEKVGDLVQNLSVGRPALDRSRNRIVVRLESEVCGVGKAQALTTCHLGSECVVALHCYAKEEFFERHMPTFTDLNNSFFFDDGYDFVAAKESPRAGINWMPFLVLGAVTVALCLGYLAFAARSWPARPNAGRATPAVPAADIPYALPASAGIRKAPSGGFPIPPPSIRPRRPPQ